MRKIERQSLKERQVVAFSYAGREGVALCHDSNTFYFAINLGEKEGEITKMDYFPSEGIEFREANYIEKNAVAAYWKEHHNDKEFVWKEEICELPTSWEDACKILGYDHIERIGNLVGGVITEGKGGVNYDSCIYYSELYDIARAIKKVAGFDKWLPSVSNKKCGYRPHFYYVKDSNPCSQFTQRKSGIIGGGYDQGKLAFSCVTDAVPESGKAYFPLGLAMPTRELAQYFGEKFIDIWAKYYYI